MEMQTDFDLKIKLYLASTRVNTHMIYETYIYIYNDVFK